ncbi:MAG: hypothetical protein HY760_01035 [Nitrospirae bacterium]|nr:hypothetical protein [Nitrospirota bacterium]
MKEINRLYEKLLHRAEGGTQRMDGKVRAEIFRRITEDLDRLHEEQGTHPAWTAKHRKIEQEIRRRLLKEIQIIIDEYTLAEQSGQVSRWEERYGDVAHYKEEFYRIRTGSGAGKNVKTDLPPRSKFVKGAWEKVEFIKLPIKR